MKTTLKPNLPLSTSTLPLVAQIGKQHQHSQNPRFLSACNEKQTFSKLLFYRHSISYIYYFLFSIPTDTSYNPSSLSWTTAIDQSITLINHLPYNQTTLGIISRASFLQHSLDHTITHGPSHMIQKKTELLSWQQSFLSFRLNTPFSNLPLKRILRIPGHQIIHTPHLTLHILTQSTPCRFSKAPSPSVKMLHNSLSSIQMPLSPT